MGTARVKGITVEIGANTNKLENALKGVNSSLRTTQTQLTDINKLLKFDPNNTELLKQKQNQLAQQIENTTDKLEILKKAQAKMDATGVDKNSAQYQALRREIIETEQKLSSLKEQSRQARIEMSAFTKVGDAFQAVGGKIENVGQKLRGLSTVATAALAACVKITADFDTSMSQVQATMGIANDEMVEFNGTLVSGEEVMTALSDKAQEMGATTKFTAAESADALNYLALAGYSAEKQIAALPSVLTLAAAGDMDLAYASDLVTDSMSVLGLATEELDGFIDQMAKTASSSNTNVAQLGEAILVAGGQASICGLNTSELNTALGVLADNGMKGSQGGTMLRNALKNLYTPTDTAAKYMEKLGLKTKDAQGNLIPIQEVLVSLGDKLDNMTAGDKVDAMAKIFDTRTIGAANALLKSVGVNLDDVAKELAQTAIDWSQYGDNASACIDDVIFSLNQQQDAESVTSYLMDEYALSMEDAEAVVGTLSASLKENGSRFTELQGKIEDSGGAASKMAKTQLNNLSGSLTILKSALEGAAIKIGSKLSPSFKKLAERITELVDKFNKLDNSTIETVAKIAAVTAIAAPLLITLGKLITAIGTISKVVGIVVASMNPLIAVFGACTLAIGACVAQTVIAGQEYNAYRESVRSLNDEQQQLADTITELSTTYGDLRASQDEVNRGIADQTATYQGAWEALQSIVDENGKVLEGHEKEAQYLTTTLAEAYGIQIQYLDGQIQGYKDLADTIDAVILKKEAEALLSSGEAAYTEAINKRTEVLFAVKSATDEAKAASEGLEAAEWRLERASSSAAAEQKRLVDEGYLPEQAAITPLAQSVQELSNSYDDQSVKLGELQTELDKAKTTYEQTTTDITNYDNLLAATISGNSEQMQTSIDNYINKVQTAETGTRESLTAQRDEYRDKYGEIQKLVEDGSIKATDKTVLEAKRLKDTSEQELKAWVDRTREQYAENITNADDHATKMGESGEKSATDFGDKFETHMDGVVIPMTNEEMERIRNESVQPVVDAMPGLGEQMPNGLLSGWNATFPAYRNQVLADMKALSEAVEAYEVISSPSKRWAKIGKYMAEGLGVGWGKEWTGVANNIMEGLESLVAPQTQPATINVSSPVYLDGKLISMSVNQQLGVML